MDGHFYRIYTTNSVVEYTEKGLVINNQITMSPEAYNQMDKEYLQQKLDDIKHYPTQGERQELVDRLIEDYASPEFKEMAESYVEGTMTPEQEARFEKSLVDMGIKRKDQLFRESAKYISMPKDQVVIEQVIEKLTGSSNLSAWKQEKQQLEADKSDGKISEEDYQQKNEEITKKIEKAERASHLRKFAEKYCRDQSTSRDNIGDECVKQQAGGNTEKQWQEKHDKLQEAHDKVPDTAKDKQASQKKIQVGDKTCILDTSCSTMHFLMINALIYHFP